MQIAARPTAKNRMYRKKPHSKTANDRMYRKKPHSKTAKSSMYRKKPQAKTAFCYAHFLGKSKP
jgi:hypothetical protein